MSLGRRRYEGDVSFRAKHARVFLIWLHWPMWVSAERFSDEEGMVL